MKKISLFSIGLLVGVLLLVGYSKTYAACNTIPGIGVVCANTDVCSAATCLCNGNTITNGQTCVNVPTGPIDGSKSSMSFGEVCSDGDGCTCTTPTATINVVYGASGCVWDVTLPQLTAGTISVSQQVATFTFTSDKAGTISYQGACANGSLSSAIVGTNTLTYTLANGTYSNCQLKITDALNNVSSWLSLPSFVVNTTTPVVTPVTPSYGGGGGGMPSCYISDLVCTDGVYVKKSTAYCIGGNLGKSCATTGAITTGALINIISSINGLTLTGFTSLVDTIKSSTTYSQLKEYTIQGVKVKIYIPKYSNKLIKGAVLSLTTSLTKAINKKLLAVTDPSYMIENYENLALDSKITVYKDIGAITKLYNDFLATLYIVLDMGRKDILPLAKYYLQTYLNEYIKFIK